MSKAKKEKPPVHKMGQRCGYDEFEDGSILPAPAHAEPLKEALQSEAAVHDLLAALTKQCHALLVPIRAAKERFWKAMAEDYGLELDKYDYSFSPTTGRVYRREKAAKPEAAPRGETDADGVG